MSRKAVPEKKQYTKGRARHAPKASNHVVFISLSRPRSECGERVCVPDIDTRPRRISSTAKKLDREKIDCAASVAVYSNHIRFI